MNEIVEELEIERALYIKWQMKLIQKLEPIFQKMVKVGQNFEVFVDGRKVYQGTILKTNKGGE